MTRRRRDDVTLAVLVGGRAERFGGRLKPLAQKDGRALAARILETLGPGAQTSFLVAPRSLGPRFSRFGSVVEDPGAGPGPAVIAAARHTRTPWLMVIAGDHVSPSEALAERLYASRGGFDAVVVGSGDRLQSGFALYRTQALRQARAPEPFSLWRLLRALNACIIDVGDLPQEELAGLEDIDTAADAERLGVVVPGCAGPGPRR